jgi:MoCo/4Fe-4S cofactor protein with predicted Tat translocation signal
MSKPKTLDFKEFRARVGDLRGREYWRSLEELSRSEEFDEFFKDEFPQQAIALGNGVDRRTFMKLMGASVAFAGLAACQQPEQSIIPYVRQPESFVPGKPLFFATAMTLGGYATGVLVESHEFHPTKIEGNPDHPSSLGASDVFMQGSILGLYDPDRSPVVRNLGEVATWSQFLGALQPVLAAARANGSGFRLLTQTITSPTLGAQIQQLLAAYPGMKWHQWEPANRDNAREGARLAFGNYVNVVHDLKKANVIVALSSNFLEEGPGHLRYAKDFAARRRVRKGTTTMNRLYAMESSFTSTGSVADHRLPLRPSQIEGYARAIAAGLGLAAPGATTDNAAWIAALVRDLRKNRGASVVIAGDDQPPVVHAIAHAINQALGNIGSTVLITDSPEVMPVNQLESLRELAADMSSGRVNALVMLGGNPVFDAPPDFKFRDAMNKVPFRAHLSPYYDETSLLSHWHVPETHYLETWGDARAHDGTITVQQPLIAPLYNGRAALEVVSALVGGLDQPPYEAVRAYWRAKTGAPPAPSATAAGTAAIDPFEATWKKWLHDGVIAGSALPVRGGAASTAIPAPQPKGAGNGIELELKHDPTIYDGRFANNGWLQELPKPQTKIGWENVLLLSPRTAEKLGVLPSDALTNERRTVVASLKFNGATVTLPVWAVPGQADDTATVTFGYGRERAGRIGDGVGANTYRIRFSNTLAGGPGAQVASANQPGYPVACVQEHQTIDPNVVEERGIIRAGTFAEYLRNPSFAADEAHGPKGEQEADVSMYPKVEYKEYAWAMSIDNSVCTGCNGCVIACQSENNIAIVGKDEVVREREMHWLRIDRYYRGNPDNPEVFHEPVPCMQCENAPCEPVCPVGATSHSVDGLNDMTYNRCVGTRYCSNNCPYKVRRFNFFHYSDYDTPALKPMRNPDVTVRTRGVMEKCTYCVQRINAAKITAEREERRVRDGEIVTACQQACPTDAIIFGDLNDPNSQVSQLKREPTNFTLLPNLNTKPRTTYLATIRNPNPEINT